MLLAVVAALRAGQVYPPLVAVESVRGQILVVRGDIRDPAAAERTGG